MKIPGPDHPITVTPHPRRLIATFAGRRIADTRDALALLESTYPVVFYLPRKDVDMTALQRTAHATTCPYKGKASYFSIVSGGRGGENAAWSYETPNPSVAEIKDHIAFYADRVRLEEEA